MRSRYRRPFLVGLACVLATTAIQLVSPWVLQHAIDDLNAGVTQRASCRLYAALVLGIAVVGGTFRFLMRRIIVGVSRHIEYDLRNDFFAHLQRLPLGVLPRDAHRRPDVARDQRPERRPHDDRPGGHVPVEHDRRCSSSRSR